MRAPVRGFWLGDRPSRADIAIFAPLWALRTELTVRQARTLAARRNLTRWLFRVDAACQRGLGEAATAPEPDDYDDGVDAPRESVLRLAASFG
jgi:glutathione S-transferase